jgi:hypothetical protein
MFLPTCWSFELSLFFAHFSAHVDFYLSPLEQGHSNLVSCWHEFAHDRRNGRCASSQITLRQCGYQNGRPNTLLLSERMPKLQDWSFSL